MPRVTLKFCAAITVSQAKQYCRPSLAKWWIAKISSKKNSITGFVDNKFLPSGFQDLNLTLDLPAGKYLLGCGKAFRHNFIVNKNSTEEIHSIGGAYGKGI